MHVCTVGDIQGIGWDQLGAVAAAMMYALPIWPTILKHYWEAKQSQVHLNFQHDIAATGVTLVGVLQAKLQPST